MLILVIKNMGFVQEMEMCFKFRTKGQFSTHNQLCHSPIKSRLE